MADFRVLTGQDSLPTQPLLKDETKVSFIDLPYEIRLQIYRLIHLSSPIQHTRLAPWYCIPTCRTYTVKAILPEDTGNESESIDVFHNTTPKRPSQGGLLSSNRPLCRIPTAFLQSCRAIHAESRVLPFQENEFVFINWFSLGLSAALAFTQGREHWQRAEMRYMRLEVFARDLVSDSAGFASWVQLCGHLPGLWGLRLMVYVEGGGAYQTYSSSSNGAVAMGIGEVLPDKKGIGNVQELVCERTEWIEKGLSRLRELRQLEVELVDVKWAAREKVDWSGRLRGLLKASNGEKEVKIVCVEKLGSRHSAHE